MRHRNRLFSRMASSTGHLLRTASGCLLVIVVSLANASSVEAVHAPLPAAALTASIPQFQSSALAAAQPSDFADRLCPGFGTLSLSAPRPVRRRCALGGGNPPARQVLKTARLQVPSDLSALQRPSSAPLANSFLTAANRQRAP